jgi:arginase
VIATARRVSEAVRSSLEVGDSLLVVGGDCTIAIGVIAGCVSAGCDPGLVYFDMHTDLNVPSSVIDGALDWMGLAHMLGVDGSVEAGRDVGLRSPLLKTENVAVIGFEDSQATDWERDVVHRIGLNTVSAADLRADPHAASRAALEMLARTATPVVIHFDVDVVDFVDAPLSENTGRNVGITLEQALAVLDDLVDDPRATIVTVTELNPHHASADPEAFDRFVTGLATAAASL